MGHEGNTRERKVYKLKHLESFKKRYFPAGIKVGRL
jgi:hypothetical protein